MRSEPIKHKIELFFTCKKKYIYIILSPLLKV